MVVPVQQYEQIARFCEVIVLLRGLSVLLAGGFLNIFALNSPKIPS